MFIGAVRLPLCFCEPACGKKGVWAGAPTLPKGLVWEGVSKANFQSHSRALISHAEVASVASGLHVVMDTKAWDPRDGEKGDEWLLRL